MTRRCAQDDRAGWYRRAPRRVFLSRFRPQAGNNAKHHDAAVDYQSGLAYEGARRHVIAAGTIPIVMLVKNHTVLPLLAVAQSTSAMNWNDVHLRVFSTDDAESSGTFTLPGGAVYLLRVSGMRLVGDPLAGRVRWRVSR